MYGPALVRHGDRVFPQRSVLCVFDIWKSPRPIYIAFLWCLWTDAILRLKQGTKSGEFRKTGWLPGSGLSYGHNTDFHKIKPFSNLVTFCCCCFKFCKETVVSLSLSVTCHLHRCKRCKALWRDPCLPQTDHFGRRTIEEMNISGEHPPLVARHCDRQPRTGQFAGKREKLWRN